MTFAVKVTKPNGEGLTSLAFPTFDEAKACFDWHWENGRNKIDGVRVEIWEDDTLKLFHVASELTSSTR